MRKAKSIDSLNIKRYKNILFRKSVIGKQLYKNRLKIEQLFSVLKGLYNLENPRLYGQARYECHIKQVLLAYLIDEYNKKKSSIIITTSFTDGLLQSYKDLYRLCYSHIERSANCISFTNHPFKGILLFVHILYLLIFDFLLFYCIFISSNCINIISFTPQLSIYVFIF